MQKLPTSSRVVSSPFMQKLPKGLCVIQKPRAGLDLDGDFLYSCLVCCYCCCVALSRYDAQSQYGLTSSQRYQHAHARWKVHIMWYKKLKCRCTLFVSHSKYVSMTSLCFSPDGKSSFTCCKSQAISQITFSYMFFVGLLVKFDPSSVPSSLCSGNS